MVHVILTNTSVGCYIIYKFTIFPLSNRIFGESIKCFGRAYKRLRFLIYHQLIRDTIMITLTIISFCVLGVTLVHCADNNADGSATTLNRDFNNDGLGPYNFLFETSNGIKQSERSSAIATKNVDELLIEVIGSYSYPGTDGKIYEVKYVANATGFYPSGDHIKVPPVVPWPSATVLEDDSNVSDSGSDNNRIITGGDQGKVSIIDDGSKSTVTNIVTEEEVNLQSVNIDGVNINATSSGTQITNTVGQNTYIPPPQTTYLPPHLNTQVVSNPEIPKNINQLLFNKVQPEIKTINVNEGIVLLDSDHISENQKREIKYEMLNPNSKMNKFANPTNIVYFILKPKGFSMPS